MPRPSKFNREEAIDKVMNILWRNGYEASSVKALSEELGITRSSFYNAFGSREDLFREAVKRYADQSPDKAFAQSLQGVNIKKLITRTFHQAVKARLADQEARGCLLINSVTELCNVNNELGPELCDIILSNRDRLREIIQAGLDNGEFPKGMDVQATALSLQSQLIGINVLSKAIRDEDELWSATVKGLQGLGVYDETFSEDGMFEH
ncbi:TetR family transcriptional regulator [Sneathiella sp. P13V-1]|uniref:TetR/AcrR family transcriptional regulator n=1 Tax=Sneathiella sp. P13V-1 TaxID=2697366 RepID=UPI00187BB9ED|nr:TetR/AcrR family transcriptional regulator [Sneathiella sp. P13V-1]MBE7636223.1 TetR family transcriptional regulator [Sneathiella sp. P13V-1]